jgi:hypothetical protein
MLPSATAASEVIWEYFAQDASGMMAVSYVENSLDR